MLASQDKTIDTSRYEKYDALIFDMDGTLIDSGQLHEQAWSETLNHFKLPIDRPYMRSLAGVPTLATLEMIKDKFSNLTESNVEEMSAFKEKAIERLMERYIRPTALAELIRHFYGKKPMALGTGANTDEAKRVLRFCKLETQLDAIVGADQVQHPKPAPDTFLLCAELINARPENCVVFEDSPLGLQAAKDAGMHAVDVAKEHHIFNHYFL